MLPLGQPDPSEKSDSAVIGSLLSSLLLFGKGTGGEVSLGLRLEVPNP